MYQLFRAEIGKACENLLSYLSVLAEKILRADYLLKDRREL